MCVVIGMFQKLSREPGPNGRHHRKGAAEEILTHCGFFFVFFFDCLWCVCVHILSFN